jgi:two-component system, response regulator YesN
LRESAAALLEAHSRSASDDAHRIVAAIDERIERDIAGDLSLTTLADHVMLSPSYLCRLYRHVSGHGLSDRIAMKRLELGQALLREGTDKIAEVAHRVGLDAAYFTRFFKRMCGMTPREYRSSVRDGSH